MSKTEEAAQQLVEKIKLTVLSRNSGCASHKAIEGTLDASYIVKACEEALSDCNSGVCVHCAEGVVHHLVALMEAGFCVAGFRLAPGESFWDRQMTITVAKEAGYSDQALKKLLERAGEELDRLPQ